MFLHVLGCCVYASDYANGTIASARHELSLDRSRDENYAVHAELRTILIKKRLVRLWPRRPFIDLQ
jgi:hypothetical protein